MKPLEYHPAAQSEIESAHEWYLSQSVRAADGSYEELIPIIDRITGHPDLYPRYLFGAQRAVLSHYPYSVVFRERLHDIQIVAIAHAKRRPGYLATQL